MKRVIVVTGGNGGLGQAIASAFLAEADTGTVVLNVNRHRDRADALADSSEGRCRVEPWDVTQASEWKRSVAAVLERHGQIDVLVNNAGNHEDGLLATLPIEAWDRVLALNLDGVFHGCQAVMPAMISQRSGRIVNIASLSALLPPAGQANYAAAKAGVLALTRSLAKEVARIGITVNAVCPGYIETDALAGLDEAAKRSALAQIPARRFGRPDEVAAAVRFLACSDASYITGSVLKIDGGIL
ncbi:MAG: SDR family oxidoreductase [Limisphaerales bacterium]